ncbi:MAG: TIM barrel protein [bacterium]
MNASHRILPGLVSITFRRLPPREIVALAAQSQLAGIEWGGDVHVPHGDLPLAHEVGAMTRDAGLSVAAYGSYYKVGESESDGLSFAQVLETAIALGSPLIRVWAGDRGSAEVDPAYRRRVTEDACRIAGAASGSGIAVAFEYHGGSLTDTADSAAALMAATAPAGMLCCWQPPVGWTHAERLASLNGLAPFLANLHVFHWLDTWERRPLAEGAGMWEDYLRAAIAAPVTTGSARWALLEFVCDDDPASLAVDAGVLMRLSARVAS